jgi:outer membrane protein insertion porin family
MKAFSLFRVLLPVALYFSLLAPLYAADGDAPQALRTVQVSGNERVESATITTYVAIKPGDIYDPVKADESVKNLYATGLFSDVSIRQNADALFIVVRENPLVNQVVFEGNKSLSTESLQKEISLKPRGVFTPAQAQADAQRLGQLYIRDGRYAAKIVPKTIAKDQNRVDVVFEVDEGKPTYIQTIQFSGNKVFSNSTLKEVVMSRETAWYRFLSTSDSYDPNRLSYDQELLTKFYQQNGYAAVTVGAPIAELTPAQDGFLVTFPLVEGPRYQFGKIDLQLAIPEVSADQLRPLIKLNSGDWYNAKDVDAVVVAIGDKLGSLGYALADVEPQTELDPVKLTVALNFVVKPSPKVFVESITVRGNTRTSDEVVRREFRLAEGDAFNTAKLKRSRERVKNLNFFEKVDVNTLPGSAPDRAKIEVDVAEKSTGSINLGAGYSTSEQLLANFSVGEKNLLGEGKDLRLATQLSTKRQEYNLSYTEPYFLDRNMTGGFDLFRTTSDYRQESSYKETQTGLGLRTSYEIDERWSQQLRYRVSQSEVRDVTDTASLYIQDLKGTYITSEVGQSLLYDRRDNRIQPTSGYFAKLSNDLAGVGGNVNYLRNKLEATDYQQITDGVVLAIGAEGGAIFGLDGDVRIPDRFFLGGQSFPGFRSAGLGPRDTGSDNGLNEALGGNYYYLGRSDLGFPLGLPSDFDLRGHLFGVAGTLTSVDEKSATIRDDGSLRASVGIGIAWESPFGPIRVDYAKALVKENFDRTENFLFNFGTQF